MTLKASLGRRLRREPPRDPHLAASLQDSVSERLSDFLWDLESRTPHTVAIAITWQVDASPLRLVPRGWEAQDLNALHHQHDAFDLDLNGGQRKEPACADRVNLPHRAAHQRGLGHRGREWRRCIASSL